MRRGRFHGGGGGFADIYSADLAGFALPTQLHPLLGDGCKLAAFRRCNRTAPAQVDKGQHLTLTGRIKRWR